MPGFRPRSAANANASPEGKPITESNDQSGRPDRLWTVDDLAEFLGVPVNTIYKWRSTGDGPPAYRVGKHLRFAEHDVHQWLATQRDPR